MRHASPTATLCCRRLLSRSSLRCCATAFARARVRRSVYSSASGYEEHSRVYACLEKSMGGKLCHTWEEEYVRSCPELPGLAFGQQLHCAISFSLPGRMPSSLPIAQLHIWPRTAGGTPANTSLSTSSESLLPVRSRPRVRMSECYRRVISHHSTCVSHYHTDDVFRTHLHQVLTSKALYIQCAPLRQDAECPVLTVGRHCLLPLLAAPVPDFLRRLGLKESAVRVRALIAFVCLPAVHI